MAKLSLKTEIVAQSLAVFSSKKTFKLYLIILLNTLLGLLDLVAIALVGVLASLAINGKNSNIGERTKEVLSFFGGHDWEFSRIIFTIALITATLFFIKTLVSINFTRRILHFLSLNAAELSSSLVANLLTKPITTLESKTSHETLFLVTRGVEVLALKILATFFMLIADVFLTLTIFILIFLIDPLTSILAAGIFVVTGLMLNLILHTKASTLGESNGVLNVKRTN